MTFKNHIIEKAKFWYALLKKIGKRTSFFVQYYLRKFYFRFKRRVPQLKKEHLHSFPALHLRPMDGLDFFLKFSGELIVVILAFLVMGLNLYLFHSDFKTNYSDNSLAAKFLAYHPALNMALYKKNTSIITTVEKQNAFIAEAQAEGFVGISSESAQGASADESDAAMNEEGLAKPNPDSIQSLIAKQVKVYETKPGDTLASIAAANGLNIHTIMWANKLTSQGLKPGWFLIILPTDGILHKATSNDTLPDLAAKYNPEKYNPDKKIKDASADNLLEKIISYNGLANAEDIDVDQLIIIAGGKELQPPAPAKPKPKYDGKTGGNLPVPQEIDNGTGHLFPWGYCTWYVASKIHVPWGGNAKNWLANAKAYGAVVSKEPAAGAIVVTTDSRRYGHVALVESVDENGFTVSEMNYEHFGRVDTRWIPNNYSKIRGFIYH